MLPVGEPWAHPSILLTRYPPAHPTRSLLSPTRQLKQGHAATKRQGWGLKQAEGPEATLVTVPQAPHWYSVDGPHCLPW